jgi:hypothetical protein
VIRALLLLSLVTLPSDGGFPHSKDALQGLFPNSSAEVETIYFTKAEQRKASGLAGTEVSQIHRIFHLFADDPGMENPPQVGYAIVDIHRVRTKKAAWLFGVSNDQKLVGVRTLGFAEPREYLPSKKWFRQFEGKVLNDQLKFKKGIDGVTGATLSSRAAVHAARRALAVQQVLTERSLAPLTIPKPQPAQK